MNDLTVEQNFIMGLQSAADEAMGHCSVCSVFCSMDWNVEVWESGCDQ